MKLNPPASSSDLEVAREIARRLHHHRRREDKPGPAAAPAPPPTPEPAPAPVTPAEPPRRAHAAVAEVPPAAEEVSRPLPFEPPAEPEPAPAYGAPDATPTEPVREAPEPEPEPASPPEPALTEPEPALTEPEPALAAAASGEEVPAEEPAPPSWDEEPAAETGPADTTDEADDVLDALASVPPPDVEPLSPGGAGDVIVDVEEGEPPQPDVAAAAAPASAQEEELFDAPPPPSWDEIADNCMRVAGAQGAMLVDPRGQVFAARGAWPEPGPDAIAGRLVAMMDRALRDAPTRSVSAPVAGVHLTAWRIPTSGGLITTALVADAPVRAELRQVVDTEIHRGAGS